MKVYTVEVCVGRDDCSPMSRCEAFATWLTQTIAHPYCMHDVAVMTSIELVIRVLL